MGIDSLKSKQVNPLQGAQKAHGHHAHKAQGAAQGASSGSSLVEKLNSMDNKLNQGGGVSLSDSSAGIDAVHRKQKL